MSFSAPVSRRKLSSACDRVDLGELALRRLAIEPAEKARHRRAVAQLRGARAGEFGLVLDRLHQRDRIGAEHRRSAGRLERLGQPRGRGRRVEGDAHALAPRPAIKPTASRARRSRPIRRAGAHRVGNLAPVDEQRRAAVARQIGEAQRQRRMRDVGAADVEQPSDVVGVADQRGRRSSPSAARTRSIFPAAFSPQNGPDGRSRAQRRGGPVAPDRVDRIRVDRDEFAAGGSGTPCRAARPFRPCAARGRSPGVRPASDWPRSRRSAAHRRDGEPRTPRRRPAPRPERCSGRRRTSPPRPRARPPCRPSRRTRQPQQSLGGGGDVFVLVLVGARHDEPSRPRAAKLGAQRLDARRAVRRAAEFGERLDNGSRTRATARTSASSALGDDTPIYGNSR